MTARENATTLTSAKNDHPALHLQVTNTLVSEPSGSHCSFGERGETVQLVRIAPSLVPTTQGPTLQRHPQTWIRRRFIRSEKSCHTTAEVLPPAQVEETGTRRYYHSYLTLPDYCLHLARWCPPALTSAIALAEGTSLPFAAIHQGPILDASAFLREPFLAIISLLATSVIV